MSNESKMYISDLPSSKVEILQNTPGAGDQIIYIAYCKPTIIGVALDQCVIKKVSILATGTITSEFSINGNGETLTFDKKWADRATLTYKTLSY